MKTILSVYSTQNAELSFLILFMVSWNKLWDLKTVILPNVHLSPMNDAYLLSKKCEKKKHRKNSHLGLKATAFSIKSLKPPKHYAKPSKKLLSAFPGSPVPHSRRGRRTITSSSGPPGYEGQVDGSGNLWERLLSLPWVLLCDPGRHAQWVDCGNAGKQSVNSKHAHPRLVQEQKCIDC